ncbi:lipocalin-like protein [Larkinella arboricola]|uniref:Lipocalin-like protein n=1 Tax=Larkinella arboricola TaxID=643671 RepID=A0A327WQU3_LARAB|nr:lipocalin family protein [Larkinella arboricola]RAJ94316.1 lipocalin-like protein [Larkinella arboricola]
MKKTTVLLNRVNFRYGWTLVMLLALPLWFASCSKDKDGNGEPDVKPNAVEGSWKISGMKTDVDIELPNGTKTRDYFVMMKALFGTEADALIACLTDSKIIFNGNGTVTGTSSPNCQSEDADDYNPIEDKSTWKVDGNKMTITSGGTPEVYDMTISGNTMTLSMPGEDMNDDGKADKTIIEMKKI